MEGIRESAYRPYFKPVTPVLLDDGLKFYSRKYATSTRDGKESFRRRRTTFTPEQTQLLEQEYLSNKYMNTTNRRILASRLNLQEIQVKTWFQNRRAKDKKDGRLDDLLKDAEKKEPSITTESTPSNPKPHMTSSSTISSLSYQNCFSPAVSTSLTDPSNFDGGSRNVLEPQNLTKEFLDNCSIRKLYELLKSTSTPSDNLFTLIAMDDTLYRWINPKLL